MSDFRRLQTNSPPPRRIQRGRVAEGRRQGFKDHHQTTARTARTRQRPGREIEAPPGAKPGSRDGLGPTFPSVATWSAEVEAVKESSTASEGPVGPLPREDTRSIVTWSIGQATLRCHEPTAATAIAAPAGYDLSGVLGGCPIRRDIQFDTAPATRSFAI